MGMGFLDLCRGACCPPNYHNWVICLHFSPRTGYYLVLATHRLDWVNLFAASGDSRVAGDGVLSIPGLGLLESKAATTFWSVNLLYCKHILFV